MSEITECPICGGELQGTIEQWTKGIVLDDEGNVLDFGEDSAVGSESRYYCENDHTMAEIQEALLSGSQVPETSASDLISKLVAAVDQYTDSLCTGIAMNRSKLEEFCDLVNEARDFQDSICSEVPQ